MCKGFDQVKEDILRSENKKGKKKTHRSLPRKEFYAFTTMGIQGIFNFLAFLLPVRSVLQVHDLNSAECVSMHIEARVQKCARTLSADARANFYGVTIGTGLRQTV